MILKESLTALIITLLFVTGFFLLFRHSGTRHQRIWIFLIVFAATWAGGVWIRPFGPQIAEIHWLAYVLAAIIAVCLLGIFIPRRPPYGRQETLEKLEQIKKSEELQQITAMTLGVMFWVVLTIFILGIVFRYVIKA